MGTGLALGREGPTVQMGAGIGHLLATAFRRNQDDVKALLAAGAGAGLTTAFSAPCAGAVFFDYSQPLFLAKAPPRRNRKCQALHGTLVSSTVASNEDVLALELDLNGIDSA
jgi:hypothetical protein